jgi:protein-tyrosine phosphatase
MTSVLDVQHVLFICTGNYYRSRFAELLFNAAARERGLLWRASSRGTDVHGAGRFNVGPISAVARQALEARRVPIEADLRFPIQLTPDDLAAADLIVAVCEAEHRSHVERDFPAAAHRVEYWDVEDLGVIPADEALPAIEQHVRDLIERLARHS